jgi:hypothetical protein
MNKVLIKEAVGKETDSDTFPGVLLGLVDPRRPFESKEICHNSGSQRAQPQVVVRTVDAINIR